MGINLGDPVFRGIYHGRQVHEDDLEQVVQRALDVGCTKLMVTGSDLKESAHAIELAEQFRTYPHNISCPSILPLTRGRSGHVLCHSGCPSVFEQRI